MATPTSLLLQDLATNIYSRRLLLLSLSSHRLLSSAPIPAAGTDTSSLPSGEYIPGDNNFDSNVLMVFSVLLCALVCSLGLNSIIRCVLKCSTFVVASDDPSSSGSASTRLANTGVKRKALKTFPVVNYSPELNLPCLDTDCAICLSEYTDGERIRILPRCHHGFHVRCIDKWLSSHSSCPTCRHCLIDTCQKILRCSSTGSSLERITRDLPQQVEITIEPLEPEGPVRDFH